MNDDLAIRRALVTLNKVGKSTFIKGAHSRITALARGFGTARGWPLSVETVEGGCNVTHVERIDRPNPYAQVDALEVGQHVVFDILPALHRRVRSAVSMRQRDGSKLFLVQRDGDGIRVTRMPVTNEEAAAAGTIAVKTRGTKYDLDRLATVESVHFDLDRSEHHKVRLAACNKARVMGWVLSCKVDAGGIRVTRTA